MRGTELHPPHQPRRARKSLRISPLRLAGIVITAALAGVGVCLVVSGMDSHWHMAGAAVVAAGLVCANLLNGRSLQLAEQNKRLGILELEVDRCVLLLSTAIDEIRAATWRHQEDGGRDTGENHILKI